MTDRIQDLYSEETLHEVKGLRKDFAENKDLIKLDTEAKSKLAQSVDHLTEELKSKEELKGVLEGIHETLNDQSPYDDSTLIKELEEVNKLLDLKPHFDTLTAAIKAIPTTDEVKINNLSELIAAVKANKVQVDLSVVVEELKSVHRAIEDRKVSQDPKDYQPFRRVIKVANNYYFDDQPTPIRSGGGSSIPSALIRSDAIAVVNPDGSNIGGGTSGGGLTDEELRAEPIDINTGIDDYATAEKQDDAISELQKIRGFDIPPYDEIAASYPTDTTEVYAYKSGGSEVATVTVTYTDGSKANLLGVTLNAS